MANKLFPVNVLRCIAWGMACGAVGMAGAVGPALAVELRHGDIMIAHCPTAGSLGFVPPCVQSRESQLWQESVRQLSRQSVSIPGPLWQGSGPGRSA